MAIVDADAVVLVGNGASVSYFPDLNLESITHELRKKIVKNNDKDLWNNLVSIAWKMGEENPEKDFEALIGAMSRLRDQFHSTHAILKDSGEGTDGEGGVEPLNATLDLIDRRYQQAVCYVLETIRELSKDGFSEKHHLTTIFKQLTQTNNSITVSNLNYDGILLYVLFRMSNGEKDAIEFQDVSRMYRKKFKESGVEFFDLKSTLKEFFPTKKELAERAENPVSEVVLLHLHGSLGFWKDVSADKPSFGRVRHISSIDQDKDPKSADEIPALKDNWWRAIHHQIKHPPAKGPQLQPVVLLTNSTDKSSVVREEPFRFAYTLSKLSLRSAKKLIIIGYSFRDESVNQMLRDAIYEHIALNEPLEIFVSDRASDTSSPKDIERLVKSQLDWGRPHEKAKMKIHFHTDGVELLPESDIWQDFLGLDKADSN